MNIQCWIEKVREDARRQKGRTLVLAAISLLAVVMWAPHVWSALSGGSSDEPATPATGQPAGAAAAEGFELSLEAADQAPANEARRWRQWRVKFQSDAHRPLAPQDPEANLFVSLAPDPEPAPPTAAPAPPPPPKPPITPAAAGLRLESTLSTPGGGAAVINRKVWRVDQEVEVEGLSEGFKLTEVATRQVTLERDGLQFVLELPPRPMGTMHVHSTAGSDR